MSKNITFIMVLLLFSVSLIQAQKSSAAELPDVNRSDYESAKKEWIKNHPEEYQKMNPGTTTQPAQEVPSKTNAQVKVVNREDLIKETSSEVTASKTVDITVSKPPAKLPNDFPVRPETGDKVKDEEAYQKAKMEWLKNHPDFKPE